MSKLLEFFLGSLLVAVFTVAALFFSVLQYVLRVSSHADCTWQGLAKTWIDANRDGQMDRGELPLAGVRLHVDDVGNRLVDVVWPVITEQDGESRFYAPIPECLDTNFEIYVDVPEEYHLTTRARIEVNSNAWESLTVEHVYYFGFIPDK